MRTIILALLFFPIAAIAQKQDVFLKLTDASGKQITGDATTRGFEKQIGILTVTAGGKNNTQLTFSMPITGASAELKRAMATGQLLTNGTVTVTKFDPSGRPGYAYIIKMEGIKVNACTESVGCNNAQGTVATVTATRIGWTYYQTNPNGTQTISSKYGYDASTGQEWTNF